MKNSQIIADEMMLRRSLISAGDKNRLWSVIRKADRGETITFSVIGGSITQGCLAEKKSESYAEIVHGWWKNKFSWTPVNYINAGIGATDSYIGVHRVKKDIVSHSPDVVIVEFSVNDTNPDINSLSYKSLLKKILLSEKSPAVILLFTVNHDGTNMQEVHAMAGAEYNLPMISLANALFPEIEKGNIKWNDLFADDVHPSSAGHNLIGQLVNSYLDDVYSEAYKNDIVINSVADDKDDIYAEAEILDNRNIFTVTNKGFVKSDISNQFPYGWTSSEAGSVTFETEFRNLGIMYYRTTDGLNGVYSVYIDDVHCGNLNGDFSGGWGNFADYSQIYTSDKKSRHVIRIEHSRVSVNEKFTILGLCIS